MITLENKKIKGDKQGLRCSFKGCDFITTITKKCKAKKKVRIHEETHKALTNIETTNDDQARSMSNVEIARSVTPEGKYADKTNRTVTVTPEGKYADKTNITVIVETKITENTIDTKIEHTNAGYDDDEDADGVMMKHFVCEVTVGYVEPLF